MVNKKDLLKECEIQTFRSQGPGGQHVNTTESGVRLKHRPTGLVVMSQKERSQHANKLICLEKLQKKIEQLQFVPKKRIPTKKTLASQRKRLEKKKRHARQKNLRRAPFLEG